MSKKFNARIVPVVFLLIMVLQSGCATFLQKSELTPEQRQLNLESFEYVWTTIHDGHYDPDFGGLDWQAVRRELRPKMKQARTIDQARSIMYDMVSRLGLTHFSIIPAEVYTKMDQPARSVIPDGVTGLDVRIIDSLVLVTRVEKDSPAALAGVKTGWVIDQIGPDSIASRLQPIAQEYEGRTLRDLVLAAIVKYSLSGSVGDSLIVQFRDDTDQSVALTIPLVEKRGQKAQFGFLPLVHVWIDVDTVDQTIGYIAFNAFVDPPTIMPVFNQAMKSFMNTEGLIIDLRGNTGGIGAMAMGMAGWLVDEKNQYLGTLYTRDNELKVIVNQRADVYAGPLAILVDGLSASCSEFFAGGLQDLGRARIFGSHTAGAALPSTIEKLPNGGGFQYVHGNYISRGGQPLEGRGVMPDVPVPPTRDALLQGRDLVLESAVNWIRTQN